MEYYAQIHATLHIINVSNVKTDAMDCTAIRVKVDRRNRINITKYPFDSKAVATTGGTSLGANCVFPLI